MNWEDFNILNGLVEEFRQERTELDEKIRENKDVIKEDEIYIRSLKDSETDDHIVFSPRSVLDIHKDEIERISFKRKQLTAENEDLTEKRNILSDRIEKLEKVLNRINIAETDERNKKSVEIDSLTARERDVLIQVAKGMLNKEIATSMNISERTVKNHLSSIFKKIEVSDRTQAAIFALKNGLISSFD